MSVQLVFEKEGVVGLNVDAGDIDRDVMVSALVVFLVAVCFNSRYAAVRNLGHMAFSEMTEMEFRDIHEMLGLEDEF